MKYRSIFHLLAQEFEKAKIPVILVGGFAINYYEIATRIIPSVEILMTEENFKEALLLLEQGGYQQAVKERFFARLTSKASDSFLDVDVVFADSQTFADVLEGAKEVEFLQEVKLKVPSLRHLFALEFALPPPRSLSIGSICEVC